MKIACAHTKLENVDILVENPRNPNKHSQRQIDLLAKIIDYQGQRSPIVISKTSGFITKGHGRLAAIKQLGWEKCAIDIQEYDNEAQEYADLVADNKIAELAEHDDIMMIEGIKDLKIEDFELLGLDDFKLPDVEDVSIEDIKDVQDKDNPKIVRCPLCDEAFDAKDAKQVL